MLSKMWDEITSPMDKQFHPTLYNGCDYLSMFRLKLTHVSETVPVLLSLVISQQWQLQNWHCKLNLQRRPTPQIYLPAVKAVQGDCQWRWKFSSVTWAQHRVRPASHNRAISYLTLRLCNSLPTLSMMTSSNGDIFRVTGHLCGEFTGPHKGQWRGALMFSLICVWINVWVNNREADDLRRYRSHCDVIVMQCVWATRSLIWVVWICLTVL